MWPDRVSNRGPLTYESGALPTVLHGPAEHLTCPIYKTGDYPTKLLQVCISVLCNSAIKWGFLFQNNPEDLDPSKQSRRSRSIKTIPKI